jgi:hypothetical protein
MALYGNLSPAAAAVDALIPVLRNVRLSMRSPFARPSEDWRALSNRKGE